MAKVVTIRNDPGFLVLASRFLSRLRPVVGVHSGQKRGRELACSSDKPLVSARFPRSAKYNSEWILASIGEALLSASEWLAAALDLRPGMRVLDLGCGRAASSIFFGEKIRVQVGEAGCLWLTLRSADVSGCWRRRRRVSDSCRCPLAAFRPGVLRCHRVHRCVSYYGTDDLYLNYLARFLEPGQPWGLPAPDSCENSMALFLIISRVVDPGSLVSAFGGMVAQHWERTGIVDIECRDTMPEGWRPWLDWHTTICSRQ